MKTLIKILFTALLIAGFSAVFADTQDRHLTGFHAIQLSGSFDVYITQGNTESVKVEAAARGMAHIITEINGDVLKLYSKNEHISWGNMFGGSGKVAVYVTVKDIRSIMASGSGDVYFKDGLNAAKLEISLSGSGDALGKLNVKLLDCRQSGSGDIKVSGRAGTSTLMLTGSGDFSGRALVTDISVVHTSGSGDASVNVNQKLDARTSGSGDIRYTGDARQVSSSSNGSGGVHRG